MTVGPTVGPQKSGVFIISRRDSNICLLRRNLFVGIIKAGIILILVVVVVVVVVVGR